LWEDMTVSIKKYDPRQTVDEGILRRANIVDHLFSTDASMGYLMEASDYIKNYAPEIDAYRLTHDTEIITIVTNDTDAWMDDIVPQSSPSITMRVLIIDALTV